MRILISGGFGFVGGRTAQYLSQAGHQVILGSRNPIKAPIWLSEADVVKIEWGDSTSLEHSCKDVDVVIQAAGMNAQDCASDSVAALEFNGVATARLVDAASRARVKSFIYLSTSHVYSNPLMGIITEKTCPSNLHSYATSHLAGEHAVLRAHQLEKIQGVVLRLSNAFGKPMSKDVNCWMLLVNDLCRQVVENKQLILHSSGVQSRDFVTMHDVTRAIDYLINSSSAVIGDGLFNLGGNMTFTVLEMAELIAERARELFGEDIKITRPESGKSDSSNPLYFKIDKLQETGFQLLGNMSQEIDNTLNFCAKAFRNN
jgi:UDP-glucose 4-epimerase